MNSCLEWSYEDIFMDPHKAGAIFETFVYNELMAQIELEQDYRLYHYRDRAKREIDFILEDSKNIYGIEVKSSSTGSSDYFNHLKWFKNNLVKDKNFTGIVLYTGENYIERESDNMHLVPMNNLWD